MPQPRIIYPVKLPFKKKDKDFLRQTKTDILIACGCAFPMVKKKQKAI